MGDVCSFRELEIKHLGAMRYFSVNKFFLVLSCDNRRLIQNTVIFTPPPHLQSVKDAKSSLFVTKHCGFVTLPEIEE